MRSPLILTAAAVCACCAGCTTTALQQYTVSQIQSTADYRSEAALQCLAAVAANPGALPGFATLADGATSVKDTATLSATTTWTRAVEGFATQVLAPMAGRNPTELWTLDPVADATRLEAMRCACRWAISGPEGACGDCAGILADPEKDLSPGPHFGVADRLERMPVGWLHVGRLKDAPMHARYKAHCGNTWVWVMPDGTAGLAEFVLVLHDIATIDVDFGATTTPPVLVTLVQARLFPTYQLTEGALDALRNDKNDKMDPDVLKGLQPLTTRGLDSREGFLKELAGVLGEGHFREDQLKGVQDKVVKQAQQANLPYSTQVNYSDIRVIEPGYLAEIKKRIETATASGQPVAITWQEWQEHSKPYHGTRTNVKPDGVQPPHQALPTRPLEGAIYERAFKAQGLEGGLIFSELGPPLKDPFGEKK